MKMDLISMCFCLFTTDIKDSEKYLEGEGILEKLNETLLYEAKAFHQQFIDRRNEIYSENKLLKCIKFSVFDNCKILTGLLIMLHIPNQLKLNLNYNELI